MRSQLQWSHRQNQDQWSMVRFQQPPIFIYQPSHSLPICCSGEPLPTAGVGVLSVPTETMEAKRGGFVLSKAVGQFLINDSDIKLNHTNLPSYYTIQHRDPHASVLLYLWRGRHGNLMGSIHTPRPGLQD